MRPFIVPIFIPHEGCPHRCLFCEQGRITGVTPGRVSAAKVERLLNMALSSTGFHPERHPQVAFYGGTFTGLPLERMEELLGAAAPYLHSGRFRSIRVSTRPDALDAERLDLMKRHGVETVEVGAQSMNDRVLSLSRRGHGADDTVRAVQRLKAYGFNVGLQLMPGLPGDSPEVFRSTVAACLAMRPDTIRLYPALVIKGTGLAERYEADAYRPWSLETAVRACAEACERFENEGIPVIRLGLMDTPDLSREGRVLAGPRHPAFGFLVRSKMRLKALSRDLPRPGETERIYIRVPEREIPLVRGHRNEGTRWIEQITGAAVVSVTADDSLPPGKARIDKT
ncbi:MAG: radical SAM protein [Deltaproteobacteria bacterium]|nr:radical SAM protein [Deltaproteobacteria bacterium]MBW1817195.1 radical SAM protein [Deltaproteobacteria bacterium]MBW2283487.1 radical SAM protein [Deltaproteobacteria bacterium]